MPEKDEELLLEDEDVTPAPVSEEVAEEVAEEVPEGPQRQSPEAWAEQKGFLPESIQESNAVPRPNPKHWKFGGAKVRWAPGQLVTEDEFDKAIAEQGTDIVR